jgi:hypothetical protein
VRRVGVCATAFLLVACTPPSAPGDEPASSSPDKASFRLENVISRDGKPLFGIRRYADLSCRPEIVLLSNGEPTVLAGSADGYHSLHYDAARNSLFYFRDADDDVREESPSCLPGADMSGSGPYEFIARLDLGTGKETRTEGLFYLPIRPTYRNDGILVISSAYLRFDPQNVRHGLRSADIGDNESRRSIIGSRREALRDFVIDYDTLQITSHSEHKAAPSNGL